MSKELTRQPEPLEIRTSEEQLVICCAALLRALQGNVMSGDVWWLSHQSARQMAQELGVPKEVYNGVMQRLEAARQTCYRPMAGMF